MKHKFLLKTMLLLSALVAGSSSVWATTVTKTASEIVSANSYSVSTSGNETCYTSFSLDNNITISTSGEANCGSFWGTSPNIDWRLYQAKSGDVTVTANNGFVITSITFTYSTSNSGTLKDGSTTVASGSAQSFNANTNTTSKTYTVGNTSNKTNGQVKITQFSVTYVDPSDARAETTVTITGNETSRYMDQSAATPTATVKAGETTVGTTVAWSSTNTSVATIVEGTGVITLVAPGTTTIKANYAGDASYKPSEASYTLKVYGCYASIEDMQTATASAPYNTATGSAAKISLSDALVTYVNGSNAYIIDEEGYGALIYENSHGFTAGQIISGDNLEVTLCLFGGATEIKGVKSADVTTSEGSVTPQTKTIGAVSAANQSMMVKFENVIYNSASSSFTDNTNSIVYVDKFSVNPTLSNGGKYDVTGLLIIDGGTLKVAPIAAEGIVSKLVNPTSQWKNGESSLTEITINKAEGTKKFTFETNSNGTLTYSSTVTSVATIAADGTITPVGYGTTVIKASTTSTADYNADEKSFTLTVSDEGVDYLDYSGIGVTGTSYSDWNNKQFGTDAVYKGNTAGGNTSIQMRSDKSTSGIVTTTSGGKVCKITVAWNSNTTNGRTIDIYGKNSPYTAASDLYNAEKQGTKLGSIAKGSTELTVTGNYGYIGIRSNSGALYLDNITIQWDEDIVPISIGAAEWTSYVASKNVYFPTGTTGYIVKAINTNTISLKEVLAVEAGTPVLIEGAEGTYGLEVVDAIDCDDVSGNKLAASDGNVEGDGSTIYALGKKGDPAAVGFYLVGDGVKVPAGKAYLDLSGSPVKEFLSFDFGFDDPDGIKVIDNGQLKNDNEIYNLAGQRLNKMQKGINIVNGKKVLF